MLSGINLEYGDIAFFFIGLGVSGLLWVWRTTRELTDGDDDPAPGMLPAAAMEALRGGSTHADSDTLSALMITTALPTPQASPALGAVPMGAEHPPIHTGAALKLAHVFCPACGAAASGEASVGFRLLTHCPSCKRGLAIRIEYRKASVEVEEGPV